MADNQCMDNPAAERRFHLSLMMRPPGASVRFLAGTNTIYLCISILGGYISSFCSWAWHLSAGLGDEIFMICEMMGIEVRVA